MELLPLVCLCLLSCSGDAVRVVVEEDSDAVLPCLISTEEDISGKLFHWSKDDQNVFLYDAGVHSEGEQFKGRVSFFQDQLQNGDASIKITRTKMADSGTYSCDFPRLQPRQTSIIELVVAVRVVVKQDSDAVLPCLIRTKEDIAYQVFDWKKDGQQEVFMYDAGIHYNNGLQGQDEQFKGRVSFFQDQLQNGNASIKITRTKMADSGTYSCDFPRHQSRQTSIIELVVAVRVVVEQDSDAVLPCLISPKEDISGKLFHWVKDGQKVFLYNAGFHSQGEQFKGRVLFFEDQLQNGNASIKITRTKMADSGTYSCDFPRHQPRQTSIIELVVGAASKPYVTTVKTADGMVLQCGVLGASPKPKVEWKDSSGNILPVKDLKETESGGLYDIVLQAALTTTDTFRCVVTQSKISHQTEAQTYASVSVPPPKAVPPPEPVPPRKSVPPPEPGAAAAPGSNTGLLMLFFLLLLLF
ncbi:CD276 antigen-like [Acanthopagrus schlegelii]